MEGIHPRTESNAVHASGVRLEVAGLSAGL